MRTRSRKDELADLCKRLRASGWSIDRIAHRIRADYRVNVRVAYRLACGLTQQQVADRWNERWPGTDAPKTSKQISYWESWPAPSGRPPRRSGSRRQCHEAAGGIAAPAAAPRPGPSRSTPFTLRREGYQHDQRASTKH